MPLNLNPEDRRILIVAVVLFLAASGVALFLGPGGESEAQYATTYSDVSEGAKAAYLLLQESGYKIQRWKRPPAELADPAQSILLLTDPTETPKDDDVDALGRFVSKGGTLIIAGKLASMFVAVAEPDSQPYGPEGWKTISAAAPSAQSLSAPSIKLNIVARWPQPKSGVALYGDGDGAAVMQFMLGKGEILWLSSSSLLSNGGISEPGNLEFLLASVGSREKQIYWDEYFHGYREAEVAKTSHPQVKWLALQLGLLALAVLVTHSRRSGPQRAPVSESRLSPLEFVQALGELYERAGAANVAVDIYYDRVHYWLTRRLGLRANASPQELADAVRDVYRLDDPEFLALLQSCNSVRFYPELSRREGLDLVQKLYRYSVRLKLFPPVVEEKR